MKNEEGELLHPWGKKQVSSQPTDSPFSPYRHLQKALLLLIRTNASRYDLGMLHVVLKAYKSDLDPHTQE